MHKVKSKTFLTYFGRDTGKGHWTVMRPSVHTAETIGDKRKTQIRFSDLIDPEIYNQTQYSAMIETTIHNDFAMFSEKEAKPIIAKRPFVIFGSMRHLEAFRSLGFKTFDKFWDESYDTAGDVDRVKIIAQIVEDICKKTLPELQALNEDMLPILEHNQMLLKSDPQWENLMKDLANA